MFSLTHPHESSDVTRKSTNPSLQSTNIVTLNGIISHTSKCTTKITVTHFTERDYPILPMSCSLTLDCKSSEHDSLTYSLSN